ncbi:Uncharacterised protein [Shigella sonnei]|nr:Uncharacterised protein [Shigella sonnei]
MRQLSQIGRAFARVGDQAPCNIQSDAAASTGNHAFCAMPPNPTTPIRNFFTLISQMGQQRIKTLFQFCHFDFQGFDAGL